jgi:hypothetical protein
MMASYLAQYARRITFGEEQSPMSIFVRQESGTSA